MTRANIFHVGLRWSACGALLLCVFSSTTMASLMFTASSRSIAFLPPKNVVRKVRWTRIQHAQDTVVSDTDRSLLQELVHMGIFCQGGSDPKRPQKVNQDAYFHDTLNMGQTKEDHWYTCVGVLDGHGLKGHVVSNYLSQQLPSFFRYHMEHLLGETGVSYSSRDPSEDDEGVDDRDSLLADLGVFEEKLETLGGLSSPKDLAVDKKALVQQAMVKAFHSAHYAAMQDKDIPAGRNGATCVMVVLDHSARNIHVAHVGDSRVIQVEMEEGSDHVKASPLSVETTVKIEAEKQRIEKGEGSIRGNNVFYGPVGIAMTRSLGNAVMLRAGVVPTPIVEAFPFPSAKKSFLVLGSDGIWDVLSSDAVAEMCVADDDDNISGDDLQPVCGRIAIEARKKWVGDLPIVDEETVDDITCMVLQIL